MQNILDLSTPALILDRPRLERNAAGMREKVAALGATLRPHVKTSKSIDVLRAIASGVEVPITVSTLAEARYFFANGVADILYAVGIAPVKLPEVAALIRAGASSGSFSTQPMPPTRFEPSSTPKESRSRR